jgi:hypothetical protein
LNYTTKVDIFSIVAVDFDLRITDLNGQKWKNGRKGKRRKKREENDKKVRKRKDLCEKGTNNKKETEKGKIANI